MLKVPSDESQSAISEQSQGPPRVSVICIFFNAERFFEEAIRSVLAQSGIEFELLLVDDGSQDGSTAVAHEFEKRNPGRVRYLQHAGHANRGMSATRNLGLAHAQGEYITFIDSDDVWRPGKLEEQAALLDANPNVGIVCGTVNYWASWKGGEDLLIPTGQPIDGVSGPPETSLALYPLGVVAAPCPSDVMIRRSVIDQVGGFEEHFIGPLQMYEDQAFFSKAWLVTSAYFSSRVWLDYRRHQDSCMETVVREGGYRSTRAYFLDWFSGWLEARHVPEKSKLFIAIDRARWRLSHPLIARAERLGRRLIGRFASALQT